MRTSPKTPATPRRHRLRDVLPRCFVICPDASLRLRLSHLLQEEGYAVVALADDYLAPAWSGDDETPTAVVHATRDERGAVRLTWRGWVGFDVLENLRAATARDAA